MRVMITGAGGRLGGAMARGFAAAGHLVTPLDRAALDITDAAAVRAMVARIRPHAVVNCAAFNAVDAAETAPGAAFELNAYGPSVLAAATAGARAVLVHFSTDFVFDGCASLPYAEQEIPHPLSVYGASKLAGETAVRAQASHYVLRVASLFGGEGAHGHRATVDHLADALLAGRPARAVVDRWVTPSYVPDVVEATRVLLEHRAPFGTYHCVSGGPCSWYDIACAIADILGVPATIEAVRAADLPTAALRPRFSALANDRLRDAGVPLGRWQSVLGRHLAATRVSAARIARAG